MEPISQIGLLCRACVSPLREETYNLIETPMLFDLYIRFSSTNISPNDSLPKSICSKCHRLLYDFQDFQRTCVESHKILFHNISIGTLKLENDEEFAIKNESSSEISQTTYSIEYMDEFIDIKLETNDSDPLMDQQDPGSFGGLMKYTASLPDEAIFSIEHMDQGSDLKLENNDSDQWRERKDEEPFGSPKEYCDLLPDLDFKDEALVELPEEIVAESISSKSLEVGNSILRTYSKRLRKKTDVVEDGTQIIGQKSKSSENPQPNQFLMKYTASLPDEAIFSIEHMDQGSDLTLENNDSDQWRERKDEEPFGSPKEYCDLLPDLDFKDEALVELPEEIVAESISSKSLEVGNSIRRTNSKRLRKKTDVVEDGTQMIGQKSKSSEKPQPNQFLMKYTAPLRDEAIFSIENMDQGSDLKLENNDSDQWRERKDEEPFGSPKEYCDLLPDLDFKDEALVELPEEIVAESISSKSLEVGNSILRTYSKRLRKKTDVVEDGTQIIGQKSKSSENPQPNQFLMKYTASLPDEAIFSIEHMDQGSDLTLENNDSDQWRERKDEEPFGSPKEYCDLLPDLDFKDEALVELPEEIVAESISSKSLEVGNSILRTYSKRLRKKTDVVEDGTQIIGQKSKSSENPQPNQFLMKYTASLPDEAIFSIEHMDQGSDLTLENNDSDQWRERKDEEPFGSPKEYCDLLPDLDFKDEALIELPEEIVAESPSSKSLEQRNSIRRTYSKRLRKKTGVVEDGTKMIGQKNRSSVYGTQMIGQKNESSEKPQPNLFVCEKCSKKFRTKVHYEGHLRWHDGKKPYTCKQCYAEYTSLYWLKRHVLLKHTGYEVRVLGRIEDCEKNYLNKKSLELHMNTQSSSQIYELLCKTLSKKSLKELKMMQNRHACDHCSKKFYFDYQLKRHKCKFIRSIKKYRCSLCGMTKTTMTQLEAHMNIHTSEKKYSCKFCESRFVLRGSLLQHAREVHDDIKLFLCSFCDHLFELETFKHHMMQHMGENRYN